MVELSSEVSLAQPFEMACILSVDKRLWCLRADFTNAVWLLNKAHQTENAAQFPVAQVLDVVMNFLRLSVVREVVSAGHEHTCVIDASGKLQCFGNNSNGRCDVPDDLGVVVQVSAGGLHTCAVDALGKLQCFGDDIRDQCDVPDDLRVVVQDAKD